MAGSASTFNWNRRASEQAALLQRRLHLGRRTGKVELIPDQAWPPAVDARDELRDGAWVAEATGLLNLDSWPDGMRAIIRANLSLHDLDQNRIWRAITALACRLTAWTQMLAFTGHPAHPRDQHAPGTPVAVAIEEGDGS